MRDTIYIMHASAHADKSNPVTVQNSKLQKYD